MSAYNGFKMAALAASIVLGIGSTAAIAATAPAATQLPGQGKVLQGGASASIDTATSTMTVALTASSIIDWGAGTASTDLNSTGVAGFNIGADATVNFTGGGGLLNIDSTGNPSQVFGMLTNAGNVFVANENGIIVGKGASIISTSGAVGLLANTLDTTSFTGTLATVQHFNGTSIGSGDVTVLPGGTMRGGSSTNTVLVTGAGTVNVDLGAVTGKIVLSAGLPVGAGTFAATNTAASLNVTGAIGGSTVSSLGSAGTATTNGKLIVTAAAVDGTFTNAGDLTLGAGFAIDGGLVNNKTVTQTGATSLGSVVNNGVYTGGDFNLTTTNGGITNSGFMTGLGYVEISKGGDLVNNGTFDAGTNDVYMYGGGNITNNGSFTADDIDNYEGGNFINAGTMVLAGHVQIVNGSVTNSGKLTVDDDIWTSSDTTLDSFIAGGQYYIDNTGTITSASNLYLAANAEWWYRDSASGNDSTGSVTNTGTLQVAKGYQLGLYAHNGVNLAGTVQVETGGTYKALSATNAISSLDIYAGGYDGSMLNTSGVATVATDIVTSGGAFLYGGQVKLMSNLDSVDTMGAPVGVVNIIAGAKSDTDYAVRVAGGKTVTAASIAVGGDVAANNPNVILQGTLMAGALTFGAGQPISDLFSGPGGSLVVTGPAPMVDVSFTGAVKTAKYNNSSNFRYNGLPINLASDATSPLRLILDPIAYKTNGTSNGLSAVNALVNGDVLLAQGPTLAGATVVNGTDTAVTGVTKVPNTHLVLQSTGNISTAGAYYWPGYVYLGNISADADGNAQPGTLGLGTIALNGNFSNVLPGDIAGASGIHLISQLPLTMAGRVTTNANAWVNFGTDLLTWKYSSEQDATTGPFFGGMQAPGTVVNYEVLDAASFHTHAPDATK